MSFLATAMETVGRRRVLTVVIAIIALFALHLAATPQPPTLTNFDPAMAPSDGWNGFDWGAGSYSP